MATKPDLNPKPVPSAAETNADKAPKKKVAKKHSPATNKNAWPGAFNAASLIFAQIKKNPQPTYLFIGVYVALALLGLLSTGNASPMDKETASVGPETFVSLIFLLALPVYALALADRKSLTVSQVMQFDLGRYFTVFGVTLLTLLIIVVAAIPLLIPLIWIVPWFALATYPVVDAKMGVIDALKESKRLAQDHKAEVWGVVGLTIILTLCSTAISVLPLIGSAAAAGTSILAAGTMASLYRWLQKNVPDTTA